MERVHDIPHVTQKSFRVQGKNRAKHSKTNHSETHTFPFYICLTVLHTDRKTNKLTDQKMLNVTLSMTSCSSPNPSHNIAGLGDSYTVFQECRLKSDMPGPSKHNKGQKPQRITHNQSPKEFPWTQLLTRKLCTGGEGRRAAATPDLNRMDSTAGDCLR